MESKKRFDQLYGKVLRNKDTNIKLNSKSDEIRKNNIFRFHDNGKLKEIECNDGHMEYFNENGLLHGTPAVLTIREDEHGKIYREDWENGIQLSATQYL